MEVWGDNNVSSAHLFLHHHLAMTLLVALAPKPRTSQSDDLLPLNWLLTLKSVSMLLTIDYYRLDLPCFVQAVSVKRMS